MQKVTHGKWSFDYGHNKKLIYDINEATISESYFKHTAQETPDDNLTNYRNAAEVHRNMRKELRNKINVDMSYKDFVALAETSMGEHIQKYLKIDTKFGFAFPLGISVNEILAHDTSMINDERKFKAGDVVKVDLGIHIDGCIIDSAFTVAIENNSYDPLLEASKDATYTGICLSGADARIYEISEMIYEVIESYELEDETPIRAVHGLGGHDILPYKVHGKKLVLCVPHKSQENMIMEEGEFYAIETYASTGNGECKMKGIEYCNHFVLNDNLKLNKKMLKNPILSWSVDNGSMPFTQIWIQNIPKAQKSINEAIRTRNIIAYPPVYDVKGSKTSQFEHTIHIKSRGTNSVEVFSLGEDY